MAEYLEDRRTGAHLRAHREALGLTRPDLYAAAHHQHDETLRWTERAEHPALHLIEAHHAALIDAYAAAPAPVPVPLARREQWYTTDADQVLWRAALARQPRVSWWWGVRSDAAPRGAYCHLCQAMIHGYDVGRGMTRRARRAVMAHRYQHVTGRLTPAGEQIGSTAS